MAVEQLQEFTNNATTTVPSSITTGTTSITVATGTGSLFPSLTGSEFFIVTLVNNIALDPGFGEIEIVKVTARAGDVFTVTRAQESTTAKNFPAGFLLELRPTAQAFNNIYGEILELESTKAPIASPVFTGNPQAPTPSPGDNDTSISTTAFVTAAIAATTGRLLAVQTFTTSATYTPTAGTKFAIVEVVGGGGAGGGAGATGVGQFSIGGGGGAGGYARGLINNPVSGSVVVGAGGVGSAGTTGGVGGNTGYQGLIVAFGGSGGEASVVSSGAPQAAGGAGGGVFTAGSILNLTGSPGHGGWCNTGAVSGVSGMGATSAVGGGGGIARVSGNLAGVAGQNAGGGGSGAFNLASQSARAGGDGASGLIVIYEYF